MHLKWYFLLDNKTSRQQRGFDLIVNDMNEWHELEPTKGALKKVSRFHSIVANLAKKPLYSNKKSQANLMYWGTT